MGPVWLVAVPGPRDILAVAVQEAPVAVPPVAVQVAGASIPPVVPVIVVAAAAAAAVVAVAVAVAAAAATSILVVVLPTRPEMGCGQWAIKEPANIKVSAPALPPAAPVAGMG